MAQPEAFDGADESSRVVPGTPPTAAPTCQNEPNLRRSDEFRGPGSRYPAPAAYISKRDVLVGLAKALLLLAVLFVIGIVSQKHLIALLSAVLGDLRTLRNRRANAFTVMWFWASQFVYSVIPLPGRKLWVAVFFYVYDWWGLPMAAFAHFFGSLIAFGGSRMVWRRCLSRWDCPPRVKYCCHCISCAHSLSILYDGSMFAVEKKPFIMIFLFALSPMSFPAVSLILGAKANFLSWQRFAMPTAAAAIKFVPGPVVFSHADDLEALVSGSGNSTLDIKTVLMLATVGVTIIITYSIVKISLRRACNIRHVPASALDVEFTGSGDGSREDAIVAATNLEAPNDQSGSGSESRPAEGDWSSTKMAL